MRLLAPARQILFSRLAIVIGIETAVAFSMCAASAPVDLALDWPAWRGPTRDGIAASGQNPPVQWSETENILWKSSIPGRGHGSPTVVGNRIFLATADRVKQTQSLLCLDRHTGKLLWQTEEIGRAHV